MKKKESASPSDLFRLIELIELEGKNKDPNVPDGYVKLNDGTLVIL